MSDEPLTQMINLTAQIAEGLLVAKDDCTHPDNIVLEKIHQLNAIAESLRNNIVQSAYTDNIQANESTISIEETSCEPQGDTSEKTFDIKVEVLMENQSDIVCEEPIEKPSTKTIDDISKKSVLSAEMLRRAMSINDIFVFRRALFVSSAERMNECLVDVVNSDSIDSVRTMLQNKYGINLRQHEAKAFISAIEPFF